MCIGQATSSSPGSARLDVGLTQVEASKKLKKPQVYLSKIERGERKIKAIELSDFTKVYRKDINYFFIIKIMNNNFIIILGLLPILFIIGIFLFAICILPRFIKSNKMKRYAESINANFLKREKNGFLKMFNIITGEYNGKPIEIYHYKLSSFWLTSTPFYKTYLNGKSYDGLLSVQEISKILTVGDKTIIGRFSAVRRHWPY